MNNKPTWDDAPKWAKFLAMDANFNWWWFECEPYYQYGTWAADSGKCDRASKPIGKDSLERRP